MGSAVLTFIAEGGRIAPDLRQAHFSGKKGEMGQGAFQPHFLRVLGKYEVLSISLSGGGPLS